MIARMAEDLPVAYSSPVSNIDWRGKEVRLTTAYGTIKTKKVIVTTSTAVIAGGQIRFSPDLPDAKHDAIAGLPLGTANRIALSFQRSGLPRTPMSVQVVPTGLHPINLQIRPHGLDAAIGYVAGSAATALEVEGERAAIDFALKHLEDAFGTKLRDRLRAGLATRWQADPWIGGAYSAALPGCGHLRPQLAAPIEDRLFFAGEATSEAYYSTAHGAYISGKVATEAALTALAR